MMESPRIYVALTTFHPLVGGVETQTLALCQNLIKHGYQATIVTLRHNNTWSPVETINGVPVLRVAGALLSGRERYHPWLQRWLYLLALLVFAWTLWQHRKHYDVLQTYQLTSLVIPTGLICHLMRKPLVVVVCSAGSGRTDNKAAIQTSGDGALNINQACLAVKTQSAVGGDLEMLKRMGRPVYWFTQYLLQHTYGRVIILSTRMRSYLATHNVHLPALQLIPNGVDTQRFHPDETGVSAWTERIGVVVCVAQFRYEKGIDVLFYAWQLVHQSLPQARLILVGSGPLHNQLEELAQALEIADSIEFMGYQSDIPTQLHRGNIAVLPSRWEGMPNALLEAMACGRACVATQVSGSEDAIEDGVNGLLVKPGDYRDMAQALQVLLCNPQLAQQYGQAARLTIEKKYALDHITNVYITLYQELSCACTQRKPKISSFRSANRQYQE